VFQRGTQDRDVALRVAVLGAVSVRRIERHVALQQGGTACAPGCIDAVVVGFVEP
jgi:hypothetical protein